MNKVFGMGIMACEDVQAWVGTCKFGTGSDDAFVAAQVADGAFVKLGGLADDEVYSGEKDWNTYLAYAPEAVTDDVVVIDLAEVMGGVIGGNYYKLGVKTVDLVAEAGYPVRYRKPMKGDKFWLGAGCFASVPSVGGYAGLTAGDVILTPADEKAEEGFCVAIRASKPLTQGNLVAYADGAYAQAYLVEVL
jgi:hypothetical protein